MEISQTMEKIRQIPSGSLRWMWRAVKKEEREGEKAAFGCELIRYLEHDDFRSVERLLEDEPPITPKNNIVRWALIRACVRLNFPVVSRLLCLGADPNAGYGQEAFCDSIPEDRFGILPLHIVCQTRRHEADVSTIVEVLLQHGADPTKPDELDGSTPLGWAAANGQVRAADLLLHAGADVNAGFVGGRTPLIAAAACGHPLTVKILLDHGANPNLATEQGTTALMAASALCDNYTYNVRNMENCDSRKREIIDMLLKRGAKMVSGGRSMIRPVSVPPADIPT